MPQYVSFSAFLYGLPVGFAFSFALGPVFFSLIKASLEYGFRAAVSIAIGVIVADLVLLGIGGTTILKKPKNTEGSPLTHERRIIKHLSIGFFLNIVNPANFLEWVGTASVLKTKYHFETFENVSFFVGALLTVFGT